MFSLKILSALMYICVLPFFFLFFWGKMIKESLS